MANSKKFKETREDIEKRIIENATTHFQEYLNQHGKDRAEGYKDAFIEFFNEFKHSVVIKSPSMFHGSGAAGDRARKFYYQKRFVIDVLEKILPSKSNPLNSNSDPKI